MKVKAPLRPYKHDTLEDLLAAGVTIGVEKDTADEEDFRVPPLRYPAWRQAWISMKNHSRSRFRNVDEAVENVVKDDTFSIYHPRPYISIYKEFQQCQISPIPTR